MTPQHPSLRLRPVGDLLHETFFVPAYQRGYRWTPIEVKALLDDIDAFRVQARRSPDPSVYYCLQPVVVVKRDDGSWELVDGQQRLTTLRLLLVYLKDVAAMLGVGRYAIDYATRDAAFLDAPTEGRAGENIDFHHVWGAWRTIEQWFAGREQLKLRMFECITGVDADTPNVRVIWYELPPAPKAEDLFVRLNVGRIPLTSAELIRGLFLRVDTLGEPVDLQKQAQIAQEWDLLERQLHREDYWHFVQSGAEPPPARIEYLFEVFVRLHGAKVRGEHEYDTFFEFQTWFDAQAPGLTVPARWEAVKRIAQRLDEWYEDRALFHLVGYLVALVADADRGRDTRGKAADLLVELLRERGRVGADAFDRHLRGRIFADFAVEEPVPPTREGLAQVVADRLAHLRYGKGPAVRRALLLFNVASLLQRPLSAVRYQFDRHRAEDWDIEHVRSVADYRPEQVHAQRDWLTHALQFLTRRAEGGGPLGERIAAALGTATFDKQGFSVLFEEVRGLYDNAGADGDAISNLALLDRATNRSYKNAIFPVKRGIVLDLDRSGTFVPPCTRDVFLKSYSLDVGQMLRWAVQDQQDYLTRMQDALVGFFLPLVGAA